MSVSTKMHHRKKSPMFVEGNRLSTLEFKNQRFETSKPVPKPINYTIHFVQTTDHCYPSY